MMKFDSIYKTIYQTKNKDKDTKLGIELIDIWKRDQESRFLMDYGAKIKKNGGQFDDSLIRENVIKSEEENEKHVSDIIRKYGYPGRSMVGIFPSYACQIVLRHGSLEHQIEFLPLMKSAAEKGDLDGRSVEMLEDRILVKQGKGQLYGTQFCSDSITHGYKVCPIDHPELLQERLKKAKELYPIE